MLDVVKNPSPVGGHPDLRRVGRSALIRSRRDTRIGSRGGSGPAKRRWCRLRGCSAATVENMVDLLRRRAAEFGDICGYRFQLEDGSVVTLSFAALERRALALAAGLAAHARRGDRVVLMFPPGLDFIAAFFGCLCGGFLPVPMSAPKRRELGSRVSAIVNDCEARLVLTNLHGREAFLAVGDSAQLGHVPWHVVEDLERGGGVCSPPAIAADAPAFLQYTSGSTSRPRGVVISHANLLHNLEMIRIGFGIRRGTRAEPAGVGVSWLPAYHDMGLIGGILEALYAGGSCVLMAPASFLQRPDRWLAAISETGASVSGGPNFAYDLCVRKIKDEALAAFDLSNWNVAFCGAEPIRAHTLERFAERFAVCGFRPEAFYPCYGLAEGTLLVSGHQGPRGAVVRNFKRSKLASGGMAEIAARDEPDARRLVGCGAALLGQRLTVVNPLTLRECPPGGLGEIWVQGPSVASRYWKQTDDDKTFGAALANSGAGPYLRTGDLGFLHAGELFVTGRLKELLIIRGRNFDPADIELAAQSAHPALPPDCGAAFSVDDEHGERLVLVHEIDRAYRHADFSDVIRSIRRAVAQVHGLEVSAIVLIRPAALPRTTSGKVQRVRAADMFRRDGFKALAQWRRPHCDAAAPCVAARQSAAPVTARNAEQLAVEIERRILQWLGESPHAAPEDLDRDRPFADHGVDSVAAVDLSCELESWLGVKISPLLAWQYPTPASISRHLAREACGRGERDDEAPGPRTRDELLGRFLDRLEELPESEAARLLGAEASSLPPARDAPW